jgi:hypothetical protein
MWALLHALDSVKNDVHELWNQREERGLAVCVHRNLEADAIW